MATVMGVIDLCGKDDLLPQLTRDRSIAAVPFGGCYRMIDFVLSNMVNSGIRNVSVFACGRYRSVIGHLGSGREWDLERERDGLFILPPSHRWTTRRRKPGNLEFFVDNLDYFRRSSQDLVLISSCDAICNIDFRPVLRFHETVGADVTVVYCTKDPAEQGPTPSITLRVESEGRITAMSRQPQNLASTRFSMGIYLVSRSLLFELVRRCQESNEHDLVGGGIIPRVGELAIHGYEHLGYVAMIDSVANYYRHSMNLLIPEIHHDLLTRPGRIYTRSRTHPPVTYGHTSNVRNCLVNCGSRIYGEAERSVLFRDVILRPGALVRNSVVMQGTEICEGVLVENAVIDKDVVVSRGKRIRGDRQNPTVIEKKAII